MGQPAAKEGDTVVGVDIHVVLVPAPPASPVPTPLPHRFSGPLVSDLSSDVKIEGLAAATEGSVAENRPPHIPTPPGVSFQSPPDNSGTVQSGSTTVKINGKAAARVGDPVQTCDGSGAITGVSTVMIG
ncbi:hypothetical protein E4191_11055 [Paracoccus liaowanqingii]|uniref:Type VI secretion protein n=1 Tax=Paracoccus liaowanqingii TaxID=2560053 RepID=A0A4P7HNA2_9RHOB|nr:PAAR domain-containing protein [Paracoccus liaowanqingii]QBX35173.1 hypothetical protein E4191_11055 [Paracoccus liaowanqingii]